MINLKTNVPIPVKIISILAIVWSLYFISGVVIGQLSARDGSLIDTIQQEDPNKAEELRLRTENRGIAFNEGNLGKLLLFGGIFAILLLGLPQLLIGIGLWYGKNIARLWAIGFATFFALGALMGIFIDTGIREVFDFLIYSGIGTYLLINKKVKKTFKKSK